jgi:hypothetical protein
MTEKCLTSRQVANFLAIHRDNDLRVAIGSELVPIATTRASTPWSLSRSRGRR